MRRCDWDGLQQKDVNGVEEDDEKVYDVVGENGGQLLHVEKDEEERLRFADVFVAGNVVLVKGDEDDDMAVLVDLH